MVRSVSGVAPVPATQLDAAPVCVDCGLPIATQEGVKDPQESRCMRCGTERERLRAQPSITAKPRTCP
jgi:hypothetical protein